MTVSFDEQSNRKETQQKQTRLLRAGLVQQVREMLARGRQHRGLDTLLKCLRQRGCKQRHPAWVH